MWKHVYSGRPTGPLAREKSDIENITTDFKHWGFARVKLLSRQQQEDLPLQIFGEIVQRQPWADGIRIELRGADGSILEYRNPAHRDELLAILTNPLSPAMRRYLYEGWPMHKQFGASSCPYAFNLAVMWQIREDPFVYRILCALFGKSVDQKAVVATHERAIEKLPGQGQEALAHFDLDLQELYAQMDKGIFELFIVQGKVQGKTKSTFKCLPGSHTKEFHEEMRARYAEHYPMKRRTDKFGLQKEKPDPMNLQTSMVEFEIGEGEWLIFDSRLLHGHGKTSVTKPIAWGFYMGGILLSDERAAKYSKKAGVAEAVDRLQSWEEGKQVKLWPGFDPVHEVPLKHFNFPAHMEAIIAKLVPIAGSPHPYTEAYPSGDGTVRYKIKLPLDPTYVPPVLTQHGLDMLLCHSQDKDLRAKAEAVNAAAAARRAAGAAVVTAAAPAAAGSAARGGKGKERADSDDDCVFVQESGPSVPGAGGGGVSKRKHEEIVISDSE